MTTEETTETTTVTTEVTTETTEETTEIITTEPVPLNLDIIYDEPEVEELTEEETPLGAGLPQTGQLPAALFYGFGGLISAAGVYIKKRR
ncbi:MAG TPA: hypothetical protein DCS67_12080 [Clostridiales bacterium UBA8960]|nr:hypothetical protein [Clostridiales bacterium UBA8960]